MHTTPSRTALTAAMVLLAACGGRGDGGDPTPPGALGVRFTEASADGAAYVGQPTPAEVPLHVTLSRAPDGDLSFAVAGADGAFRAAVRSAAESATAYRVYLTPRTDLAVGAHTGMLTLVLCPDPACATPYAAEGNTRPFRIDVAAALSVTVKVGGVRRGTAAVGSPAAGNVVTPAQVELDANAPMTWAPGASADALGISLADDSTAAAWKATLTLPTSATTGALTLTGTAQDGSGSTVEVRLSAAPPVVAGAYGTDQYPDLFEEVLGKTEAQVRQKLGAAWTQYFGTGIDRLFYPAGADMGYILDTGNGDIRSEGMSYGMMIALQLDHQDVFDALWRFARTYSLHAAATDPWQGYLAWQLSPGGFGRLGNGNASDGEEWFATALLLAANRWGDGGAFDYRADAQALLDTMLHTEDRPEADRTYTNSRGATSTVMNMFDATTHQVAFVANTPSNGFTDPSYHLPHFYELWARWADRDNAFWCAAAAASRSFLAAAAHPTTGLAPDYAQFDGAAYGPTWGAEHANFEYDAFRVGANVGVDHLWFGEDAWQVTEADRLLGFFHGKGANYASLWTLSGSALNAGHGAGLAGTNAALALATSDAALRREFVQALWDWDPPAGTYRYYDGLLYTLALLQVSGNFRVYHPMSGPVAACP